ncbi:hypothetical protein CRENPOLYSF2_2310017 [Crenothrix polyspora]|uniref:Uncharacterized protein n=1 Tax=Crenothrix polyspora TaxID=360316 RepID=A0A1R4H705_9GAMM|nr:hypothetical protein CRENPOLYSF2_2310017 [Crenothrix polyspora]
MAHRYAARYCLYAIKILNILRFKVKSMTKPQACQVFKTWQALSNLPVWHAFTSPFEKGGEFTRGGGGFILKISPNPSFSKRGTERLPRV